MASENTIYFYPGRGGHSHDGENSSFIDTSKYSLFDFSWGIFGDPSRIADQTRNYISFENFIIDTVNNAVLKPANISLQPGIVNGSAHIISRSIEANSIATGTLTANEISANTITSNELTANFVLVNTIIASGDFNGTFNANTFALSNIGTDGWAITSAGDAVFTNGFFRGNLEIGANDYWYSNGAFALGGNTGIFRNIGGGITLGANVTIQGGVVATSVATPGIDIDSNGNLTSNASTFGIYANGAIFTSSGNFSVDAYGNLSAENAQIRGEISSDTFVTHTNFAGAGSWTRPTVLIDNANNRLEVNSTAGGLRITADSVLRYASGSSFYNILWDFDGGTYSFLGTIYVGDIEVSGVVCDNISSTGAVDMDTGGINGIGIAYPGCTTGPGTANYMGLVWDNPNIRGTVDNVVSAVLGTVSDIRSKANIVNAPNSWVLKTLNNLRVVEYNPVDVVNINNTEQKPKRLGLIAQEMVDVFPELVTSANPDNPDAFLSVDYLGLVPHLIQAVQDLNNRVKELESKV